MLDGEVQSAVPGTANRAAAGLRRWASRMGLCVWGSASGRGGSRRHRSEFTDDRSEVAGECAERERGLLRHNGVPNQYARAASCAKCSA